MAGIGNFIREFKNAVAIALVPIATELISNKAEEVKEYILTKVRNHAVCQELRDKTSPSRFLDSSSATLFGFLGFDAGSDPVAELLNVLEKKIIIEKRIPLIPAFGNLNSNLKLPTKDDLRSELPLDWTGGLSWPEAIEDGLDNFPYFLPSPPAPESSPPSFSNLGIQLDKQQKKVRSASFDGVPFLSAIFEEARKL